MARQYSKNICGMRVAAMRKKRRLTQMELSKRVREAGSGLDRAAIAKIENGLRSVLDHEVVALSTALKISVTHLLGVRK